MTPDHDSLYIYFCNLFHILFFTTGIWIQLSLGGIRYFATRLKSTAITISGISNTRSLGPRTSAEFLQDHELAGHLWLEGSSRLFVELSLIRQELGNPLGPRGNYCHEHSREKHAELIIFTSV